MAEKILLRNPQGRYFVDSGEPIDWTWGTRDEATRFDDLGAVEARMKKTPFEYGGMISPSSLAQETEIMDDKMGNET